MFMIDFYKRQSPDAREFNLALKLVLEDFGLRFAESLQMMLPWLMNVQCA